MKKQQIIESIAESKVVEKMIKNTLKGKMDALDDLSQDIYLSLLLKDDELIESMWERGELDFYIGRIVTNNLRSTTSPFYTTYIKRRIENETYEDN